MGGPASSRGSATVAGSVVYGGRRRTVTMSSTTRQIGNGYSRTEITLKFRDGGTAGSMTVVHSSTSHTSAVRDVQVAVHRQGLGTKLYAQAMSEARSRGSTKFASDKSVSTQAAKVWGKLSKSHKVTTHAHTQKGNQLVSQSGGPVFSLRLK